MLVHSLTAAVVGSPVVLEVSDNCVVFRIRFKA